MPGRKKPNSAKQKKAALQDKRAAKRGDVDQPQTTARSGTAARSGKNATVGVKSHLARSDGDSSAANKVKALQSRFLKLSPIYLARTQAIAFNVPLPRPIPAESVIYQDIASRDAPPELLARLACPRRPKWRYGMTKKEVERNEEGLFVKWMDEMQDVMSEYLSLADQDVNTAEPASTGTSTPLTTRRAVAQVSTDPADLARPIRSPSYYEQNLEVWRQLWRVTEQSNILLVLMDIRCPPVHFPASLRAYLRQQRNKRVILVLTKVDLVSPSCVDGWKRWCREWWHGAEGADKDEYEVDVVAVESYKREALHPSSSADAPAAQGQGRPKHVPHIPPESLRPLIAAIQRAYQSLTSAPDSIRDDQVKMDKWNDDLESRMKADVDWDAFERVLAGQEQVGQSDVRMPPPRQQVDGDSEEGQDAPRKVDFLTLGLVGQPNVGKSSLLNALLGEARVTASKTPGKTKHFQSLFWSRDVRIVDCPGLVLPSFAGVETQVMAGILPISQIPSLPACIHHAAQLMPLERILNLPEPKRWDDERRFYEEVESKKTGRDDTDEKRPGAVLQWMAGDIMTGWAEERGFLTAKAGRPDTNRAGNAIMRMIAEGRIPYRYFAPGTAIDQVQADIHEPGDGIWCPTALGQDARNAFEDDQDSDEDEVKPEVAKEPSDSEVSEEGQEETDPATDDSSEEEAPNVKPATSRFAALMMDDDNAEDSSDDEED